MPSHNQLWFERCEFFHRGACRDPIRRIVHRWAVKFRKLKRDGISRLLASGDTGIAGNQRPVSRAPERDMPGGVAWGGNPAPARHIGNTAIGRKDAQSLVDIDRAAWIKARQCGHEPTANRW